LLDVPLEEEDAAPGPEVPDPADAREVPGRWGGGDGGRAAGEEEGGRAVGRGTHGEGVRRANEERSVRDGGTDRATFLTWLGFHETEKNGRQGEHRHNGPRHQARRKGTMKARRVKKKSSKRKQRKRLRKKGMSLTLGPIRGAGEGAVAVEVNGVHLRRVPLLLRDQGAPGGEGWGRAWAMDSGRGQKPCRGNTAEGAGFHHLIPPYLSKKKARFGKP